MRQQAAKSTLKHASSPLRNFKNIAYFKHNTFQEKHQRISSTFKTLILDIEDTMTMQSVLGGCHVFVLDKTNLRVVNFNFVF